MPRLSSGYPGQVLNSGGTDKQLDENQHQTRRQGVTMGKRASGALFEGWGWMAVDPPGDRQAPSGS